MSESVEHLDQALAEEFAGHGRTIHALKQSSARFRELMEQNHALWTQIQHIQGGILAAEDGVRHDLERKRLKLLDEIADHIRKAEAH
ncbi:MAG TPA: hypothetical protein VG943_07240 [Caulobacterales bacterium]|nr:hypothetical protein [Caulobacterales bacterium]